MDADWQTKQLLPPTHPLTQASSWTKYHLAVTQQVPSPPPPPPRALSSLCTI